MSLAKRKDKDIQQGTEIKGRESHRASQRNLKVVTERGKEVLPLASYLLCGCPWESHAHSPTNTTSVLGAALTELFQADRAHRQRQSCPEPSAGHSLRIPNLPGNNEHLTKPLSLQYPVFLSWCPVMGEGRGEEKRMLGSRVSQMPHKSTHLS